MQKTGHSLKKRAISLGLSAALTFSLLGGAIPFGAEAEAAAVGISNDSLKVSIGDLGQISTLNINNNRTNNRGRQVNFVLPNTEREQNNADHQWMGEMIFSYRTSEDGQFPEGRDGFVEVDTNKTLAAGGSTTASNINPENPYIEKNVISDKKIEVNYIGQGLDSEIARAMKGFDVKSVYDMETEDGSLLWSITLKNKSNEYIEFGDVGLPMPWNNKYYGDIYSERVTAHSFAGADSGYAYAIRCSGEGNYIMFTPVPQSGARIEYVDQWYRNNNGIAGQRNQYPNWCGDGGGWQPGLSVYYIHSKDIQKTGTGYFTDATSLVLGPNEEKTYQFKFSAVRAGDNTPQESADSPNNSSDSVEEREANQRSILYKSGMIDGLAVPGFQTALNMPTKLDLHYDDSLISDVNVQIQCVHENDPYDEKHIPVQTPGLVDNDRTGRGEHNSNPGYTRSCEYVETTVDEKGEQHHIYNLSFDCIGNNSVRVNYKLNGEDKFTQFEFNVMTELDDLVEAHAEFMVNQQQDNDPNSPTYGIYKDWYFANGADPYTKNHWGDDWSHDNINFMTMKNYLKPVPEQVESIERYLIDFMWENYMKYTQDTYTVANYLRNSGIYDTNTNPYTRNFSQMMESTSFFNMYRIQKAYPDLIEYREDPQFYLEKAYGIYYYHFDAGTIGFYGEQQMSDMIDALYAEGMTEEAQKLQQRFAYEKGSIMTRADYPYGSEFSYDNTGEEGAYAAAKALRKYYPDNENADLALTKMGMADWKTRAMRGIQPTWFHYGVPVFIGGESWWNFQYTASLAGSIMDDWLRYDNNVYDADANAWASRVNYSAKMSNFNAVNMGQIDKNYVGNVSWRYTKSKGGIGAQNVFDDGTRVQNNGWNDFSGESDAGLYGSLLRISSDVVSSDPIFGLFGYGSTVSNADGKYTIVPKDGVGKRINLINEKVYLTSEQDSVTQAVVSEDGTYFELDLKNLIGIQHLSKITLDGAGMQEGYYSIKLNDVDAGQLYVKNNKGVACFVMSADDTAKVTIEKMAAGENKAPVVTAKASSELPQAHTPFKLTSTIYDDGAPNGTLTYEWSVKSAPEGGTVIFENANAYNTSAKGTAEGSYVITLTVSDGALSTTTEVSLSMSAPPERQAPVIDLEKLKVTQNPLNISVIDMSGVATADPIYAGELTYSWTIEQQPEGSDVIWVGKPDEASSRIKVNKPGEYVVRFTATDADKVSYEEVTLNMVADGAGDVDGVDRATNVLTKAGTAPTLPETADVIYADGSTATETVVWDEIPADKYAGYGQFLATGVTSTTNTPVTSLVFVETIEHQNVAAYATPSAVIDSPQDQGGVTMMNNGFEPTASNDLSHGAWHNWLGDQEGPAFVKYEWDEPILASAMDVYVFKDNSGNFQPKDMRITLYDENGVEFTPRTVDGLGNTLNQYNYTTFEPAYITGIRIDMNPVTKGCGILEWKVYSNLENKLAETTKLRELYDAVNTLNTSMIESGVEGLTEPKATALELLGTMYATQEQVNQTIEDITAAMSALVPKDDNLAFVGGLTASYTSGHERLEAVRDGGKVNSRYHWGTWGNYSRSEWIQYSWPAGKEVLFSDLYIWNDGGGIKTPPDYTYSYLPMDSDEWVELVKIDSGITANALNSTRFDEPIMARALRCTITKAANNTEGVGLWEWEVYTKKTDALQSQYDLAAAVENENYTTDSWASFTAAREAAKVIVDAGFEDYTQVQIDEAYNALKTAQDGLLVKAQSYEIDLLNALISSHSGLIEDNYTAATWADFELALDAANALVADPDNATSEAVTAAKTALITAFNALEEKALVYAPLQDQVDLIKAEIEKSGETWIPASLEFVQKAIEKAEAMLLRDDLTQQESQEMILELIDAMSFVFEKGNKAGLQYLVNSTETLVEGAYTPASWNVLEEAVAAAQIVLDDENAIDDEIAPVYDDLLKAINALKTIANKSGLKTAIDLAQNILDNADKYIAETLEGLQDELDKANAVYNNGNATQAEVDAARKALMEKVNKVRKPANKADLMEALKKANTYDLTKYTDASGEVLSAAIIAAQKVYDDPMADQKTVDEAKDALRAAMDGMVLKSGGSDEPNGGNDTPTGDSGVMAIAAMALLSGAALMLAKKRREK